MNVVDNNFYNKKKREKKHTYIDTFPSIAYRYILLKEFEYIGGEWINIARLSISQR